MNNASSLYKRGGENDGSGDLREASPGPGALRVTNSNKKLQEKRDSQRPSEPAEIPNPTTLG